MKLSCLMQQLYSNTAVTGLYGSNAMYESRHMVPAVAHRPWDEEQLASK